MPASDLLLKTKEISTSGNSSDSIASITACRSVPLVLPNTAIFKIQTTVLSENPFSL